MKERLQSLRKIIDEKVDRDEVNLAKEDLALCYLLSDTPGEGMSYNKEEIADYLFDYFVTEINGAENFVKRAFFDNIKFVNQELKKLKPKMSENSINEINKLIEEYKEKINYHYIGLEEDNDRIEYKKEDINNFVTDWLLGVNNAEEYIRQFLNDDFYKFLSILNTIQDPTDTEKLLDFIIDNMSEERELEDVRVAASLKQQQRILKTVDKKQLEIILNECTSLGVLADVCKNVAVNDILKDFLFLKNGIIEITDSTLIVALHQQFKFDTSQLFNAYLKWEHVHNRATLKQALLELNAYEASSIASVTEPTKTSTARFLEDAKEILPPRVDMKLNADIELEYYAASVNKNHEALLDLAFLKNPTLFTTLLLKELSLFLNKEATSYSFSERKSFYDLLVVKSEMHQLSGYEDILSLLVKVNKVQNYPICKFVPSYAERIHSRESLLELQWGSEFYNKVEKPKNSSIKDLNNGDVLSVHPIKTKKPAERVTESKTSEKSKSKPPVMMFSLDEHAATHEPREDEKSKASTFSETFVGFFKRHKQSSTEKPEAAKPIEETKKNPISTSRRVL